MWQTLTDIWQPLLLHTWTPKKSAQNTVWVAAPCLPTCVAVHGSCLIVCICCSWKLPDCVHLLLQSGGLWSLTWRRLFCPYSGWRSGPRPPQTSLPPSRVRWAHHWQDNHDNNEITFYILVLWLYLGFRVYTPYINPKSLASYLECETVVCTSWSNGHVWVIWPKM